jgi:glycosyltransferase involved in cell wall biosynthesis
MRILLFTTHMNIGGIGIYTLSLARSLKNAGEYVVVASSGGELTEGLKASGIEHIYVPVNTSSDIGPHTFFALFKLSRFIKEQGIDLIHAQTRVTQVIAGMLSRKVGGPVFIATCHGFFRMKFFRKILPAWGMHTIAISEPVRQHLACDLGVPKNNITVVYNGVDVKRFNRQVSSEDRFHIKRQYSLKNGPVIGTISRLSKVKGHTYLLSAFAKALKKIPEAQLLIIGDGPRNYINSLKLQAAGLGISSNVKFHPACKDTSIPLSVIDLFCHPSLQEGLGLSILEAMAMGLPVVASDVGGIYTLIKHRINGLLIPPMEDEALAEGMVEILSDHALACEMGIRSRSIVENEFTAERMRDGVIDVYNRAIKIRKQR